MDLTGLASYSLFSCKHECCLSDTKAVITGKHKVQLASILTNPLSGEVAVLSGTYIPFSA